MSILIADITRLVKQKLYDNTMAWNGAGYNGDGVRVWNMENPSEHGKGTTKRILDAAPGADIVTMGHTMTTSKGEVKKEGVPDGDKLIPADEFISSHGFDILTKSLGGSSDRIPGRVQFYKDLKAKYGLRLFNSAGNDGTDGVHGGSFPESLAIYVGACQLTYPSETIEMCKYSSLGDRFELVDFSTFTGEKSGTSFSAPYLAGIAALLIGRYGPMSQDEIYEYFKMCAEPIDSGHNIQGTYDGWSGYGIPVLPAVDKNYVTMAIGSKTYCVDGEKKEMNTAPFIKDGRTFVPVAFAALALGAKVFWDSEAKRVRIVKDDRTLLLTIGDRHYILNGKPFEMDTAPFIQNQRTYVPVAFIAQALGCKVAWVESDRKVCILEG